MSAGFYEDDDGLFPYAGTSGWSGSDTSMDRALESKASGLTSKQQRDTMVLLDMAGEEGMTWGELARALQVHHGTASGLLSVLHKAGRIARLTQRRSRSKVYVRPEFVAGRDTEAQGRRARPSDDQPD